MAARLGNKLVFRCRTRAAVMRLRRPLTSAPPLPLCRQINWAPKTVAVTTLPAAADLSGSARRLTLPDSQGWVGRPAVILATPSTWDFPPASATQRSPCPSKSNRLPYPAPAPPGPWLDPTRLHPFSSFPTPSTEFGLNFRTRQSSPSVRPGAGSCVRPLDSWSGLGYIRPLLEADLSLLLPRTPW